MSAISKYIFSQGGISEKIENRKIEKPKYQEVEKSKAQAPAPEG